MFNKRKQGGRGREADRESLDSKEHSLFDSESLEQQKKAHEEIARRKGATILHLPGSSYGGNLIRSDAEREELLSKFRAVAAKVIKEYRQ